MPPSPPVSLVFGLVAVFGSVAVEFVVAVVNLVVGIVEVEVVSVWVVGVAVVVIAGFTDVFASVEIVCVKDVIVSVVGFNFVVLIFDVGDGVSAKSVGTDVVVAVIFWTIWVNIVGLMAEFDAIVVILDCFLVVFDDDAMIIDAVVLGALDEEAALLVAYKLSLALLVVKFREELVNVSVIILDKGVGGVV